jgi:diadenosine tetraphosphate (Ap4A) HIT family hydrolase
MSEFQIHSQLLADNIVLGRLPRCFVLLNKNAVLPWFILVPETQLKDLLDLPTDDRQAIMQECSLLSRYIKEQAGFPKVNFAAIGNVVPQMHLHVIGRSPADPCWPKPVWGNLPPQGPEYFLQELAAIKSFLSEHAAFTAI